MKKKVQITENELCRIIEDNIKFYLSSHDDVLEEMARVGFIDNNHYEIYVNTNDPGNIPHFHIRDASTRGEIFHTCIRFDANEYFHHTGKEGVLNAHERKCLIKFFNSPTGNKKFNGTNWELAVYLWNLNNSNIPLDDDIQMPDYTHFCK